MTKTTQPGRKGQSHVGSSLDDLLEREGVRTEFEGRAVKEAIAWQIQQAMEHQSISKARMAALMGTSRAQLDRLLDPQRDVTLSTLSRAAQVVGKTLRLELT